MLRGRSAQASWPSGFCAPLRGTRRIIGGPGLNEAPVRVEALLLAILAFADVNVVWVLLFDETPSGRASAQGTQAQTSGSRCLIIVKSGSAAGCG